MLKDKELIDYISTRTQEAIDRYPGAGLKLQYIEVHFEQWSNLLGLVHMHPDKLFARARSGQELFFCREKEIEIDDIDQRVYRVTLIMIIPSETDEIKVFYGT